VKIFKNCKKEPELPRGNWKNTKNDLAEIRFYRL